VIDGNFKQVIMASSYFVDHI